MSPNGDRTPHTRRWVAQRWLVDNVIRSVGIDWDQPRSINYNAPCGPEANADFASIRERVKKYADISPAFEAAARRREAKAKAAEDADEQVTARQNYFIAAIQYAASQWPHDENNAKNLALNQRKRECYTRYSHLADHKVEAVWVPFKGDALPGWFHLPPGYSGGRIPAVVSFPGMDSFKEANVAMYGDRWLSRGIAVLAMDGPGQYESAVLGIHLSMQNWIEAGPAVMGWLRLRSEIDPDRIGITGQSFGSFFATIACASEMRYKACAVAATCLEPGFNTIFEEASPTFKQRFMYMSGYTDEDAFDEFVRTLTWEGHAGKIRVPYLCIAGEMDELSPAEHTERFISALKCPKRLVVYQDSRHSVGNVPATNLGPTPQVMAADWMNARLAGKSFESERWFVQSNGQVIKTPL
ncbi:MAG: dipeptidyl aminopeptidase [Betaproteobacteria bacterium]|jgi:cephalosporin-C deacetylase-like acetyl esterase|nr:dipeptidyl aminopeptidase [Betaproteobacteria bacterium]